MSVFRVYDPAAILGIFVDDWVQSLKDQGASQSVINTVLTGAVREPQNVTSAGMADIYIPRVVLIDCSAYTSQFALNEIPSAVVRVPTGIYSSDGSIDTHIYAKILREFPNNTRRVRARVYVQNTITAAANSIEGLDNPPFQNENIMAYEGYLTGVASTHTSGVTVYLTHVLSALADSSSVSSNIATATAGNLSYKAGASLAIRGTNITSAGGGAASIYGLASLFVGAGFSDRVDFWGYWVPEIAEGTGTNQTVQQFERMGIQRFLYKIASENLFNWDVTPSAFTCANRDTGNNGAIYALQRLEPFSGFLFDNPEQPTDPTASPLRRWNYGGPFPGGQETLFKQYWDLLQFPIANANDSIRRDTLISFSLDAYRGVGYRYGVPIAFRTPINVPSGISSGAPLAQGFMYELVERFGPASLWDKLVGQILPTYLLALVPMADRGLVVPLHCTPDRDWLTLYVDDIDEYQETLEAAAPIRGTILQVRRIDNANFVPAGNDPSEVRIQSPGYDACVPGQFLFLPAPEWLSEYLKTSAASFSAASAAGPDRTVNDKKTKVATKKATDAVKDKFKDVEGFDPNAPAKPIQPAIDTATRLAKSLTAQKRLEARMVHVKTYLRFDIAPGCAVRVEQPTDRAENRVAANLRYGMVRGIVSRVSTVIDSESKQAYTTLLIMYARTYGESTTGPTVDAVHPVWKTAWYGAPLADTYWARTKLGNGYALDPSAPSFTTDV